MYQMSRTNLLFIKRLSRVNESEFDMPTSLWPILTCDRNKIFLATLNWTRWTWTCRRYYAYKAHNNKTDGGNTIQYRIWYIVVFGCCRLRQELAGQYLHDPQAGSSLPVAREDIFCGDVAVGISIRVPGQSGWQIRMIVDNIISSSSQTEPA